MAATQTPRCASHGHAFLELLDHEKLARWRVRPASASRAKPV
jgi:hypothetical protein